MLCAAQVEHGRIERPLKLQRAVVGQRVHRRERPGGGVDADKLDAVVRVPGDQGVHDIVHLKDRGPGGALELQRAVVGQRVHRRERFIAAVYAQQLDGAGGAVRGDECVRVAAHVKGVDAVRGREPRAGGSAVANLVRRFQGAVPVHAYKLDGAVLGGGDHGVRAAPDVDDVDVRGRVEGVEALRVIIRGPSCRDQGRRSGVDSYVVQERQRARGAGRAQRAVDGMARAVGYGPRQGARAVVVQVAGGVPWLHDVGEQERIRSVARLVRRRPLRPVDVEGELGGAARVHGGLGKPHGDRDLAARAVHAVRRDGQRGRVRQGADDGDVALAGKRPRRARVGQGAEIVVIVKVLYVGSA